MPKLTALATTASGVADDSLLYIVLDPAGTATSAKLPGSSLKSSLKSYFDTLYEIFGVASLQSVTANYSLMSSDAGKLLSIDGAYSVTIPANSTEAIATGKVFHIVPMTTDANSLTVADGVTLILDVGGARSIVEANGSDLVGQINGPLTLYKSDTNTWRAVGPAALTTVLWEEDFSDGADGSSGVFSRTGVAYYTQYTGGDNVLQEAAEDALRFDSEDNVVGLLLEPVGATNICGYSTPDTSNGWAVTTGSPVVTLNNDVAPDGTTTMTRVRGDGANSAAGVRYNVTISPSTDFVAHIFVSAEDDGAVNRIGLYNGTAGWQVYGEITWSSGVPTVTTSASGDAANLAFSLIQYSDSTWIVELSGTTEAAVTGSLEFRIQPDRTTAGLGSNFWGFNCVVGTRVRTSSIPNLTGSSKARGAEVLDYSASLTTPNATRAVVYEGGSPVVRDVDNWDYTDMSEILPNGSGKILKITVYVPGGRPA